MVLGLVTRTRQHVVSRNPRRPATIPERQERPRWTWDHAGFRSWRVFRAPSCAPLLIRLVVCGSMALARVLELIHSRRNLAAQGSVEEEELSKRTFPLIAILHTAVIAATLLRGRRLRPAWLVALVALQPVRLWVLITL